MKNPSLRIPHRVLIGAFLLSLGVAPQFARASEPDTSIPRVVVPKPNGFDLLVKAGEAYTNGVEGAPTDIRKMAFDENLAGQRQSVSRNRAVLVLARQGLALPIFNAPTGAASNGPNYDKLRLVGRLFKQEWALKITGNDWNGALNSQLDAVEMGVAMTRGGGRDALEVGLALESQGRVGLSKVAPRLTPAEAEQGALRLQKIEALRPTFAEILRVEETSALTFTQYSLEKRDWEDVINGRPDPALAPPVPQGAMMGGDGEMPGMMGGAMGGAMAAPAPKAAPKPFTTREIEQLRNLGLTELQTNTARYFEALRANAKLPYGTFKTNIPPASDPWSRYVSQGLSDPLIRLSYESARTQDLLWIAAFKLSAVRTATGKYPETLDAAPDPFRPAQPLVYKRDGDKFLLYSVGPDGKDDGGTPAKLLDFLRDDQPGAVSGGLEVTTTGDLVASVF